MQTPNKIYLNLLVNATEAAAISTVCVSSQPPFDGDDDDQLFNNIMEKPVHYPRGLSDPCKKIIQGVSCSVLLD